MQTRLFSLLIVAASLMVLLGCGSTQPARFYALSSMKEAKMAPGAKTGLSGVAVGIGPIRIADYLDRPDIVTRDTGNRLKLAEFELWATRRQ